jgi:hypothetical protein
MRTKVLICAAVLAASLASSMAQNVYSLNVVGYVNVTLPAGKFMCIANPLDATMGGTVTGGNNITNLFPAAPNGATIQPFNSANAQWGASASFGVGKSGVGVWTGPFDMPPGKGVMFRNPSTTNMVVTFVGQVQQGTSIPVATLGQNQFTLVGSPIPIGGDLTNSIVGLTAHNGDTLSTFNSTTAQWASPTAGFAVGKSGVGVWSPMLQIAPGAGFLYRNANPVNTWTCNFTVQ